MQSRQSPTDGDSREPELNVTPDGRIILSWVEKIGEKKYALRTAARDNDGWSEAHTVSEGENWFVNWADFPSVIALRDGSLAAHWLVKSGVPPVADGRLLIELSDPSTGTSDLHSADFALREHVANGPASRPSRDGRFVLFTKPEDVSPGMRLLIGSGDQPMEDLPSEINGTVWVEGSFWGSNFRVGRLDTNGVLTVHGAHLGDKIRTSHSVVSVTSAMCSITQ